MHFTKKQGKALWANADEENSNSKLNKSNEEDKNKLNNFEKLKSKLEGYREKATNIISELTEFVQILKMKLFKHDKAYKKTLFQVCNAPEAKFQLLPQIPKTTGQFN